MGGKRPQYQSKKDEKAEREILKYLSDNRAFKVGKHVSTRKEAAVDAFFYNKKGKVVAIVEAKDRNISINSFDSVFLSVKKVKKAYAMSQMLLVPAYFAVRFKGNKVAIAEIKDPLNGPIKWVSEKGVKHKGHYAVKLTGNYKRNDGKGDIEDCCLIPIKDFTVVKKRKGKIKSKKGKG